MVIIIPIIKYFDEWVIYKKFFDGYPFIKSEDNIININIKYLLFTKYMNLSKCLNIYLNDLEYYHNVLDLDNMFILDIYECNEFIDSVIIKNKLNKYLNNKYKEYNKLLNCVINIIGISCLKIIVKYCIMDIRFIIC